MEKWLYNDRENGIYPVLGNEKILNELYFSTVGKGNYRLSLSQQTTVLNIANQCPYTGGEAVYRARAMRLLFEPEYQYSDSVTCALQNIGWRKRANTPTKSTIQHWVIPNPTSGSAMIQLSSPLLTIGELRVYNLLGETIRFQSIKENQSQVHIDLNGYSQGIYIYEVTTETQRLNGKLILSK